MANSPSTKTSTSKEHKSSGARNAIFIIPIVALLVLVLLILIRLEMISSFGWDFDTWRNFSMVILLLLIVVLICLLPAGESRKTVESEPIKKKKKAVMTKPEVTVTAESADEPIEFLPLTKDQAMGTKGIASAIAEPAEATIISSKTSAAKKEARSDVKKADIVAPAAKKDKIRPKMLEYPSSVEGGIYGDTFIDVENEVVLKLRTLVVEDIYLL
jgi:hypothetical protein